MRKGRDGKARQIMRDWYKVMIMKAWSADRDILLSERAVKFAYHICGMDPYGIFCVYLALAHCKRGKWLGE